MRFDISYLGDNNVMWGKNLRVGPALKLLGTDGVCVRARVRVCVWQLIRLHILTYLK